MHKLINMNIVQTFSALLHKDITIFNKRLIHRSIDSFVWMISILTVAYYIMPSFGITDPQYGTFILIGNLAVWGFFEMNTSVAMFIGDIEGNNSISYYLSLPLPSSMIFVEQALASAYRSMASSIFLFPLGKLILGKTLILSNINWPQFILAFFIINIFYGFFTIFIASYVRDLSSLTMVRSRILFPLWFLGGFQFPWKMLYEVAPIAAYFDLCNPIVYIMDGMRSTVLPSGQYLPFWNCMIMITFFSISFGYLGVRQLKKRLDCL